MQWCIVSGGEGCDVVVSGVVSDALTGRCRMGACRQVVGFRPSVVMGSLSLGIVVSSGVQASMDWTQSKSILWFLSELRRTARRSKRERKVKPTLEP